MARKLVTIGIALMTALMVVETVPPGGLRQSLAQATIPPGVTIPPGPTIPPGVTIPPPRPTGSAAPSPAPLPTATPSPSACPSASPDETGTSTARERQTCHVNLHAPVFGPGCDLAYVAPVFPTGGVLPGGTVPLNIGLAAIDADSGDVVTITHTFPKLFRFVTVASIAGNPGSIGLAIRPDVFEWLFDLLGVFGFIPVDFIVEAEDNGFPLHKKTQCDFQVRVGLL